MTKSRGPNNPSLASASQIPGSIRIKKYAGYSAAFLIIAGLVDWWLWASPTGVAFAFTSIMFGVLLFLVYLLMMVVSTPPDRSLQQGQDLRFGKIAPHRMTYGRKDRPFKPATGYR